MVQNVEKGFYRIIKGDEICDVFFLDEKNIFICSARVGKVTNKEEIEEVTNDIKKHSKFLGKAIFVETISTNIATNIPVEKYGIVNATFMYTEINEGDIRGVLSQVIHTRYPLTEKENVYSNSYVIRTQKAEGLYEVLVNDEWLKVNLSETEYELILDDLAGNVHACHNVTLKNGDIIEIGIIDEIREC